ncbi:MAG: glycosyltransferase family 2 protein [Sedimenticola sp.]
MVFSARCSSGSLVDSVPEFPRISIVTVVLNAVCTIEQTINSVLLQNYPNLEFIVVDGGSSDGTLQVIERYQAQIDSFLTELDQGIGDAMNKGLSKVTGDFVLFLHADDYLIDTNAMSRAAKSMAHYPRADIHMFDINYLSGSKLVQRRPRGFTPLMNIKTGIWHQAALCRKQLFEQIGGFDTNLSVTMDYDFFLRAYRENCRTHRYRNVISVMRDTGISGRRDARSLSVRFGEERLIQQRHCRSWILRWLYAAYWPIYLRYRGFKDFGSMGILLKVCSGCGPKEPRG